MSYSKILAPYNARVKDQVMRETWGHLAPNHRQIYEGFILFTHTAWNKIEPIEFEFKNLEMSPWLFEQMNEFISKKELLKNDGSFGVFIFTGKYQLYNNGNYRFSGKIKKVKIKFNLKK
jgi:hypothetical protein